MPVQYASMSSSFSFPNNHTLSCGLWDGFNGSNSYDREKTFYETIIKDQRSINPPVLSLSKYLAPYFSQAVRKNDKALLAIYYCLLADQSFNDEGARNNFSDIILFEALDLEEGLSYQNVRVWVKVMYGFYRYRCLKASEALPFIWKGRKARDIPKELVLDLTQRLTRSLAIFLAL